MNYKNYKSAKNIWKGISVMIVAMFLFTLLPIHRQAEIIKAAPQSSVEPTVPCQTNQLCVIYRRFSTNTNINKEKDQTWQATIRGINVPVSSVKESLNNGKHYEVNGEKFIVFIFSNANTIAGKNVTIDVYGGDYSVRDVISGRDFTSPAVSAAGKRIYIQENDNGVYESFTDMNAIKPLKAAYFDRFASNGQETAKTDQMIFSTYRGLQDTPANTVGNINGESVEKVTITKKQVGQADVPYEVSSKQVQSLGNSHYRLKLPFSLALEDLKKHYTIAIKTTKTTYFSGPSKTLGPSVNGKISLRETNVDLAQDYANGIHFYDLFTTKDFKDYYENKDAILGYRGNGLFKVWAPFATEVSLNIDGNTVKTLKDSNRGVFEFQVAGVSENSTYSYTVTNYGVKQGHLVDPYAFVTGKDGYTAYAVAPDSPSIQSKTNHIDIKKKDAVIYEAHIVDVTALASEPSTYTGFAQSKGLKQARETGFNFVHILPIQENRRKDDGVPNAGNTLYTWGYGPQNLFAVEGSYATKQDNAATTATARVNEVKQMVETLHNDKMGVILDVGFNHIYNTYESNFQRLVPDYYYRQIRATAKEKLYEYKFDGGLQRENLEPLYEGKIAKSNPSANEFASDRTMGGKVVVDATVYFASQYKVDGFRYDLMGIIPVDVMNEVYTKLSQINPNVIIYGEGWGGITRSEDDQQNYAPQNNPEDQWSSAAPVGTRKDFTAKSTGPRAVVENVERMPNIAVFSDKFRDSVVGKVDVHQSSDLGFVETNQFNTNRKEMLEYSMSGGTYIGKTLSQFQPKTKSAQQYVNFLDIHDDYTLSDHLANYRTPSTRGFSGADKKDRQKMALSMLFLSQGTPILQAGSEFDRSKSGSKISEFYYAQGRKFNDAVIDYSALNDKNSEAAKLQQFTRALLNLRKNNEVFRLESTSDIKQQMSFTEVASNTNVLITNYKSQASDIEFKAIYNTSDNETTVTLDSGKSWEIYTDKQENIALTTGADLKNDAQEQKVTVGKGKMVILQGKKKIAPPTGGTIEITKQDGTTKAPLAGAEYDVKDASGNVVDHIKTDDQGKATTKTLALGTYTVVETKNPDGYKADTASFTMTIANDGEIAKKTIDSVKTSGTIEITKQDGTTKEPLAGAEYDVKDANGNVVDHIKTDDQGKATTKTLALGTYTVVETKNPDGYKADTASFTMTIASDGDVAKKTIDTVKADGKLEITKQDGTTKAPLAGAEYDVKDANGNVVDHIKTDDQGKATTKTLALGTYTVVETKAPAGYKADTTSFTMTIASDGDVAKKVIDSFNIAGTIEITKQDGTTKAPLAGAEYDVKDASGNVVDHIQTDDQGKAVTKLLALGTYTVVETKAPAGYKADTTSVTMTIASDGDVAKKTIDAVKADGKLEITKQDGTTKAPLAGAEYDVKDANGNVVDHLKTDDQGKATTKVLLLGTYTVVETKAPAGYKADTASFTMTITSDNEVVKKVIDSFNIGGIIEITKQDGTTKAPLTGAEYDVKDANGNIVDHIKTDAQGKATTKVLPLGTYTVVETKAPAGYKTDATSFTMTLVNDNDIAKKTIDGEKMPEIKKPHKIVVSKFDKQTGNRLSGMIFKIRNIDKNTEKIIAMNSYNVMEITDLEEGTYEITEIKAPVGYEIDNKVHRVVITKDDESKEVKFYDVPKQKATVAPPTQPKKGKTSLPATSMQTVNDDVMKITNMIFWFLIITTIAVLTVLNVRRKKSN